MVRMSQLQRKQGRIVLGKLSKLIAGEGGLAKRRPTSRRAGMRRRRPCRDLSPFRHSILDRPREIAYQCQANRAMMGKQNPDRLRLNRVCPAPLKRPQYAQDDHQVDGHHTQEDLPIQRIAATAAQSRSQQTLQHREGRLDLPALPISLARKTPAKLASITPGNLPGLTVKSRTPAKRRRKDAANVQLLAT